MMTKEEVRRKIYENPLAFPDLKGVREVGHVWIEDYIDRYLEEFINPDLSTYRTVLREIITNFMQTVLGFEMTMEMVNTESAVFRLPKDGKSAPDWMNDVKIRK